jgi:hypothetical protein
MTDSVNESTTDGDEVFNTSYVEPSFASVAAASFSKSLNDIHVNEIISISMRPNSLATHTDENLTYSCNNINNPDHNVSTSIRHSRHLSIEQDTNVQDFCRCTRVVANKSFGLFLLLKIPPFHVT